MTDDERVNEVMSWVTVEIDRIFAERDRRLNEILKTDEWWRKVKK